MTRLRGVTATAFVCFFLISISEIALQQNSSVLTTLMRFLFFEKRSILGVTHQQLSKRYRTYVGECTAPTREQTKPCIVPAQGSVHDLHVQRYALNVVCA